MAAVFLAAGVTKVTDLAGFRDRLELRGGLPAGFARPVGYAVPWLELVVGCCLALGQARREAALVGAALLVLFTAHDLRQSLTVADCGCLLLPESWRFANQGYAAVFRNLFLLAAAGWLMGPESAPGRRHGSCVEGKEADPRPANGTGSFIAPSEENRHGDGE